METLETRQLLASVTAAQIFYNSSAFDGNNAAINASDDAAIAIDKQPLRELSKATFANYSSYSRGINGIMVDIQNANGVPQLADFQFRAGNVNTDPFGWAAAPAPAGFALRNLNATTQRITFTWTDAAAVKGKWLQVTALATNRTGLAGNNVFYFGSAIGETGNQFGSTRVDATDQNLVRSNQKTLLTPAVITDPYDFNRDRKVDATDQDIARSNQTTFLTDLKLVTAPLNPASDLHVQIFSPSELRLSWSDQSQSEAGYNILASTTLGGVASVIKSVPANATAALITGLNPSSNYAFNVVPMAANPAALMALPTAPAALVTHTPVRAASPGDGRHAYRVSIPTAALTRNEAGYSGSGSARVTEGEFGDYYILAESADAAVFGLVEGSATITNFKGEQRTYSIANSGAYILGTIGSLASISGFDKPSGLSDDQRILTLEDSYEWTNIDMDRDDFYWKVDVAGVDISAQNLAEDRKQLSDPNECSPGAAVPLNDNDSNSNDQIDLDATQAQQDDPELVPADINWGSDAVKGDEVSISAESGGENVRLWYKPSGSTSSPLTLIASSKSWTIGGSEQPPSVVYVEGVKASASARNITLTLHHKSGTADASDRLYLTVYAAQVDVDSDRTNGIAPPDRSKTEQILENKAGEAGKLIAKNDDDRDGDGIPDFADGFNAFSDQTVDDTPPSEAQNGQFVPVIFSISPAVDLSEATFQINYSASDPAGVSRSGSGTDSDPYVYQPAAGSLRLWTKKGTEARNKANISADGNFVGSLSGDDTYSPSDWAKLGITDSQRTTTLWIEGIDISQAKGDLSLSLKIDVDGDANGTIFVAQDVVRLTVIDVNVLIGADSPQDTSLHDDWVGASELYGLHKHTIYNFLTLRGPAQLEQMLDVKSLATGNVGTIVLQGTDSADVPPGSQPTGDFTRTLDAGENEPFLIQGDNVSQAPDDVVVQASFNGQVFGSQTLTVIRFSPEPETYGKSLIPVNPAAVSIFASVQWKGNVFGADIQPDDPTVASDPHSSDVPFTFPRLTSQNKINYSNIEVIWGRDCGSAPKEKSSTAASSLIVNPTVNGTSPNLPDNLRVQDTGITLAMEGAHATAKYYLGHPTEAINPNLDLFSNYASTVEAKALPTRAFPTNVNIMELIRGAGLPPVELGISSEDVSEIFTLANTLLSQASIELIMPSNYNGGNIVARPTIDSAYFDATEYDSFSGSVDNLIHDFRTAAVDIYIVRSIYDNEGPLSGATIYPGAPTFLNYADPGIVLASGTSTTAMARELTNKQIGRTLAHEFIHYVTKTGDGGHPLDKKWNLFAAGDKSFVNKRDLDDTELQKIQDTDLSTTSPDD